MMVTVSWASKCSSKIFHLAPFCSYTNYNRGKDILNMVLELPPAPAALVELGRAFATLSALSAAAFLLIAVAGPPGALGDEARIPVDEPEAAAPALTGEEGRGEDYK